MKAQYSREELSAILDSVCRDKLAPEDEVAQNRKESAYADGYYTGYLHALMAVAQAIYMKQPA